MSDTANNTEKRTPFDEFLDSKVELNGAKAISVRRAIPMMLRRIRCWRLDDTMCCIDEMCDAETILLALNKVRLRTTTHARKASKRWLLSNETPSEPPYDGGVPGFYTVDGEVIYVPEEQRWGLDMWACTESSDFFAVDREPRSLMRQLPKRSWFVRCVSWIRRKLERYDY